MRWANFKRQVIIHRVRVDEFGIDVGFYHLHAPNNKYAQYTYLKVTLVAVCRVFKIGVCCAIVYNIQVILSFIFYIR
jgi:hypothetical protein